MNEKLKEMLRMMLEENTPLPGNVCKENGCGGEVLRRAIGFSGCFACFIYEMPACKKCGRTYSNAKNVGTWGESELAEKINQPMTI